MPQLDISTYSSQLFWLFICFLSLYIFTSRVSIPRISRIMEARWQRIEGTLKTADEFKEEAEGIQKEFEEAIKGAREKAHQTMTAKRLEVNALMAERKKGISDMMATRLQSSEEKISQEREETLKEIKSIAESVALAAVEKLTQQKVDFSHVKNVLNQLMKQKVA